MIKWSILNTLGRINYIFFWINLMFSVQMAFLGQSICLLHVFIAFIARFLLHSCFQKLLIHDLSVMDYVQCNFVHYIDLHGVLRDLFQQK